METALPHHFIELSINSLRQVRNNGFQLNQQPIQQETLTEPYLTQLTLKRQPLPLTPRHQETTVAAVDTSTIKIGETSTGIIIAIRGATVWKQNHKYHYSRLGPLIFHITEDNKNTVYNNLEKSYFPYTYSNHQASPPLMQMPTRLAGLLERWLQTILSKNIRNGIILFDGSLTSGTFDTPTQRMRDILSTARKNQNTILAFSKATSLRINGYLITDRLPEHNGPYLLETTGLRFKPPTVLNGDVYVAKLNKSNMAFRLDIDHQIPLVDRMEAVEKLLGNDLLQQSYPETLRLAHILCTFTANEVLAMQHFTTRRHGIHIINRPDMHKLLFGPYGREGFA
jgi:hypothetical protein